MGKLRKIGSKIAGGFRKVGRKLKKGLGKIARAFGKLGPLGSLALSFILPGIGGAISNWLTTGPMASFFQPIFNGISKAGKFLKDGVGRVFNKVTDAIEVGMNTVSKPFMQPGARGAGSAFRDFVSDVTGGFVDKSTVGVEDAATKLGLNPEDTLKAIDDGLTTADEIRKQANPDLFPDTDTTPIISSPTTPDEKVSLLDGKKQGQSTREFIKGSEEYAAYKKIAPVSAFGTSIIQNENDIANYNQSVLEQQSDYFSGYAQSFLNSGTNQQFGGSVQQSFVDVSKFQQSSNLTEDWLKTVYGNINIPTDPTQALLLAQQANPYGFQLTDIYT
tara:strand:- start:884 stop:1879 length:996 start_codon:yes stop_codon:yes gene_type:complete